MADYKTWDDFVDDVERRGDLASYPLDTLLKIYGTYTVTKENSAAIRKSLQRRGYDMHPLCIAHLTTNDFVRVYLKCRFDKLIMAAGVLTPDNDEILRGYIRENQRTLKIQELIGLAREISKE